uniref:Tf2-1-like SH3-like domain-containing protein n=1 Tax=Nicotiana tabacum TaxID=4097 RepID=A0A1S4ASE1_TOBAC|nr:PREDICTED: uncharacterized protein LOC107800719 [Nicotiana tabacum]
MRRDYPKLHMGVPQQGAQAMILAPDPTPPAQPAIAFLGHMVSSGGIKVDPKKIEAVQSWSKPSTSTRIRPFLSLVGYYHRFVEGFSSIPASLTKLTQNGAPFRGSDNCGEAFSYGCQALANRLMRLDIYEPSRVLSCVVSQSSLFERIKAYWYDDPHLLVLKDTVQKGSAKEASIGDDGVLRLQGRCELGMQAELSTTFHPQTERQSEWTIQILKDMLRSCTIDFGGQWDQFLPLAKKVCDVAFMEGEEVLLRDSLMKGMIRFGKKEKLSPRFIGHFEVLKRVGEVAYRLVLPPSLSGVHLVFHVSMLQNYHKDKSHVLNFIIVQLDENLVYEEEQVAILDRQVRKLKSKEIVSVKVWWRGQTVEEET